MPLLSRRTGPDDSGPRGPVPPRIGGPVVGGPGVGGPVVGGYRLLAQLGEGGMGVVHLAAAPDGRRVALKVLRPHIIGDAESRQRLAREVMALERVTGPRVAGVLDADPWGEVPFVVTRYVPGLSLHQWVREHGPLPPEDLAHLAVELLDALSGVHAAGILHRDVKPSNVVLEGRSPVLIDFGLARLADDPRITQTGVMLGTPGYLAPEVIHGDDPTVATDLHGWAATVAFAGLGEHPYGSGPTLAVLDRVRRGEHRVDGLPGVVRQAVRAALAVEPWERPTLPELRARLVGGSAGLPGEPPDPDEHTLRLPRPCGAPPAATVPYVLASGPGPQAHTGTAASPTRRETAPVSAPATPMTRPITEPRRADPTAWMAPARAPYQRPPEPARDLDGGPRTDALPHPPWVGAPEPTRPRGVRRLLHAALVASTWAVVAVGTAAAPYLAVGLLSLVVLALRAVSHGRQADADRVLRRGRRAWWDSVVDLLASPWYLLRASLGAAVLVGTAAVVALPAGVVMWLAGGSSLQVLLVTGVALGFMTWWGPGGDRVRESGRRLSLGLTRSRIVGALAVACLLGAAGAMLAGWSGPDWSPTGGAPWRQDTLVGDFLSLLVYYF